MTKQIERHPRFHAWYVHGDFVLTRTGGRIATIRRYEYCEFCPTERRTRFNVARWERIGKPSYKYAKGVEIVRVSQAEWTRRQIVGSTNLEELKAMGPPTIVNAMVSL